MATERNNRNTQNMYDECKRLMNYHTIFKMKYGTTFDGIIESIDEDRVIISIGEDIINQECENQNNK